jgi:hypothetical protein
MSGRSIGPPELASDLGARPNSASRVFVGRDVDHGQADARRVVLARLIETLAVAARACAAAHYYEDLKRLSDDELASRGLRRADLPRAAFYFLTSN